MFKFANHGHMLFPEYFRQSIRISPSFWRWGTMCNNETLVFMACLAKTVSAPIVEFGTFIGRTTRAMAMNTDQKIYTIDIGWGVQDPSNSRGYDYYIPGDEFRKTPEEERIELIIGDSLEVDLSRLYGTIGLVFIDGGHSKEVVESDTQKAFQLIRPDGMIVWDDCNATWPEVREVVSGLNEDRMLFVEKDNMMLYWGPATSRLGSIEQYEAA